MALTHQSEGHDQSGTMKHESRIKILTGDIAIFARHSSECYVCILSLIRKKRYKMRYSIQLGMYAHCTTNPSIVRFRYRSSASGPNSEFGFLIKISGDIFIIVRALCCATLRSMVMTMSTQDVPDANYVS